MIPMSCTAYRLYVRVATPPGGAETLIFTLQDSGANTALTVTLTGATTNSSDLINTVNFLSGARLTLKVVASAAAASSARVQGVVLLAPR
jgi:hypothetical protein